MGGTLQSTGLIKLASGWGVASLNVAVDLKLEENKSPLQEVDEKVMATDIEESILGLVETLQQNNEVSQNKGEGQGS